jgi:hypothetical protein
VKRFVILERIVKTWPAVALVAVLAAGLLAVRLRGGGVIVGVAFVTYGLVLCAVGTNRILKPDWRTSRWWHNHPVFRLGFSIRRSTAPVNVWTERAAGLWQLAVGTVFIAAGVLIIA